MKIEIRRAPCAQLAYRVLAHLDLGRDAANLHRRGLPRPSWLEPLEVAYRAAGLERLELQFAGLSFDAVDTLLAFAAKEGSELWHAFAHAIEAERTGFDAEYQAAASREAVRIELGRLEVVGLLSPLREALWSPRLPPPLTVLHVPALGRHGRGYPKAGAHRVAVSLDEPWEHVLCQIFHEEVHPISDRELTLPSARDTRAGTAGAQLHAQLESHALARGEAVIRRSASQLLPAYERWRDRSRSRARARGKLRLPWAGWY